MAGRMGGGEKSIEDFPRYTDHFADLFGDDYISSTEHLQNTCAEHMKQCIIVGKGGWQLTCHAAIHIN